MKIVAFKKLLPLRRDLVHFLAVLCAAHQVIADSSNVVDQGQRDFEKGAFNRAAAHWEKAVESFRKEGKATEEVLTSVSLASAYQSFGQQRRAVQTLEDALTRAEKSGDRSH